jgi:hypothetical protein
MGLKYHVKLPKKTLSFSHLSRFPSLKARYLPLLSSLRSLFSWLFHSLCFSDFFSSLSFYFYFYLLFLFFHSLVFSFSNRINFSFLASVFFFLIQTENHRYNWVGILKGIIDIIGLEFESVFLFFSWYFFPYS